MCIQAVYIDWFLQYYLSFTIMYIPFVTDGHINSHSTKSHMLGMGSTRSYQYTVLNLWFLVFKMDTSDNSNRFYLFTSSVVAQWLEQRTLNPGGPGF